MSRYVRMSHGGRPRYGIEAKGEKGNMHGSIHDQALGTIEHYFGIGGADAEALLDELVTVDVAGGEWLFHQGDPADALFFLVRGRLQVWVLPYD